MKMISVDKVDFRWDRVWLSVWRLINSGILFMGFYLPWLDFGAESINGFYLLGLALSAFSSDLAPSGRSLDPSFPIVIIIFLYGCINVYLSIFKFLRNIVLMIIVVLGLGSILGDQVLHFYVLFFWGLGASVGGWGLLVVALGLVYSFALELIDSVYG